MSELSELWDKYKILAQKGERTTQVMDLEKQIHDIQKSMNSPIYDFDGRWERIEEMSRSTVSGPPSNDEKPDDIEKQPQGNFSLEQAKSIIKENTYSMLEETNKYIEAMMICVEHIAKKTNPKNQLNAARCGQSINLTIGKYYKDKEQ